MAKDKSNGGQPDESSGAPAFQRPGGRGTGGRGANRRRGRPPPPPTTPPPPGAGGAGRWLLPHLPATRPDLIALVQGQAGVANSEYVQQSIVCTPTFYPAIAGGLLSIPDSLHRLLHQNGVRLWLGDFVVSVVPTLRGRPVPGWSPGSTYEHVAGVFHPFTRRAIVAEFENDPTTVGRVLSARQVPATVREELGHALDWTLGSGTDYLSQTDPGFRAAYNADVTQILDPIERHLLGYLLGPGHGLEETFACLFATIHGGYADPYAGNLAVQRFARCLQSVRAIISPLGGP